LSTWPSAKNYEPLLLLPIGFGVILGNIPFFKGFGIGIYEAGSVLHYLYFGVTSGVYPSIIFLGLGAMTDFSFLLANPKLMLLGAAAQMGIFFTYLCALALGFTPARGLVGGHHRRRRRPDLDLSHRQAGAAPHRSGSHRRLFLHGPDPDHPAADHEAADQPEGDG
jgi:hypothetical protein